MSNDRLNRREFLSALAGFGMVMGLGCRSEGFALPPAIALPVDPAPGRNTPFATEAARLTQAIMDHYWDNVSHMFRAPVLSSETVPSDALRDRGYTLWPSLIALHALIEGERSTPGSYTPQIAMVYDGLEQYYSDDLHAYTSWVHFPGNVDAYYDDNSWAVIVLVEASMACRPTDPVRSTRYLERAKSVMADYVVKGYDATGKPGGMRWGTDTTKPNTSDRGTSSTAGGALAALMLARAGVDEEFYTNWGLGLLSWLTTRLLDADGLIMDALAAPDWAVRSVKWTYNTGVPMRAYVEHYRLTKSRESLAMATRLARAAIDLNEGLFDRQVHDPAKRYYWDGTYFVHYLLDGLLQVAQVTPDAALAAAAASAASHSARYAYTYLRDSADGFYWRNWRLYTIGAAQHARWQQWTRQTITPEYDPSERSQEPQFHTLAVQDRPLVKTLLANAGAARLFWLVARLPQPALSDK
jgi:hypothetical protein